MVSPITSPQPRFAPRCEQRASNTENFPLAVRNATRSRPNIRFPTGPERKAAAGQNKYHAAGLAGKLEASGAFGISDALSDSLSCSDAFMNWFSSTRSRIEVVAGTDKNYLR